MNRRFRPDSADTEDQDFHQSEPFMLQMRKGSNASISCEELLKTSPPPRSGFCMKKNNSLLSKVLPCLYPQWKKRFFVLCGNYLYRFALETDDIPKGVPIPIDSCTARVIDPFTLELSTLRKIYQIRTTTEQDCKSWVTAIKTRKLDSIRENMGHVSVCEGVIQANRLAAKLFEKRLQSDAVAAIASSRGGMGVGMGIGGEVYNPMSVPVGMSGYGNSNTQ